MLHIFATERRRRIGKTPVCRHPVTWHDICSSYTREAKHTLKGAIMSDTNDQRPGKEKEMDRHKQEIEAVEKEFDEVFDDFLEPDEG
jgi:hypothetical protein